MSHEKKQYKGQKITRPTIICIYKFCRPLKQTTKQKKTNNQDDSQVILQFLSFPFSISVHDFCRSEARYRIIVAFLRLKYVLVEIGIVFLLIKILFTLVILQKSMKESVDNLKIQHILLNWNNIFLKAIHCTRLAQKCCLARK